MRKISYKLHVILVNLHLRLDHLVACLQFRFGWYELQALV